MTFDDYQLQAAATALHAADPLLDKTVYALGIAGEAGEVADKWKKVIIYQQGKVTEADKAELKKELGDVLWYVAMFASQLGLSFDDLAQDNLHKLASRQTRGVIKGEGDNR